MFSRGSNDKQTRNRIQLENAVNEKSRGNTTNRKEYATNPTNY